MKNIEHNWKEYNKNGTGFLNAMLVNGNGEDNQRQAESNISMYISLLSNMFINNYLWTDSSDQIEYTELNLIEQIILRRGWCVIVKPKVIINGNTIQLNKYMVYEASQRFFNIRNQTPTAVNLLNINYDNFNELTQYTIDPVYNRGEFAIISCFPNQSNINSPYARMVWDYANKLNEIDLAINMQNNKLKVPIVARMDDDKATNNLMIIAETQQNNGIFTYVDNRALGQIGVTDHVFQEFKSDYYLDKLYTERNNIIEDFGRMLGITTSAQQGGTYVAESVQFEGLGFNQFRRQLGISNRNNGIKMAKEVFGLELKVETMKGEEFQKPQAIKDKKEATNSGEGVTNE